MVSLKQELEAYFNDNWVDTPIQWDGIDFSKPVGGSWIGLKFNPIDRALYAYDGQDGRNRDLAQLEVMTYGKTTTASISLGDDVKTFIENWKFVTNDAQVGLGVPDGNGVINLESDIFESVLTFEIISYN